MSRETVQSTRVMTNLKKLVKSKVLDTLKKMGDDEPEKYGRFWKEFARSIKQGVAIETDEPEALHPLLRFHTTLQPEQVVVAGGVCQGDAARAEADLLHIGRRRAL